MIIKTTSTYNPQQPLKPVYLSITVAKTDSLDSIAFAVNFTDALREEYLI